MGEVFQYSDHFYYNTKLQFTTSVANVPQQSLMKDLNDTCVEYVTNMTCVKIWMKKWMEENYEKAVKTFSPECSLQICSGPHRNVCIETYRENFVKISIDSDYGYINRRRSERENSHDTSRDIYNDILRVLKEGISVAASLKPFEYYHYNLYKILNSSPSLEPFKYDNLLRAKFIKIFATLPYSSTYKFLPQLQKESNWGIIQSSRGKVEDPCLTYRDIYPWGSNEYRYYFFRCYGLNILQSDIDLLRCSSTATLGAPLSWSTVPFVFVHSECLCVAANGKECRVKAPEGVQLLTYCLFQLLRDFQKQVTFRPALTYLDYSFMTVVPTCQLTSLIQNSFYNTCKELVDFEKIDSILSVQCNFYGLLNDTLNCTEMSIIKSYNVTFLCDLYLFMDFVNCDADVDASVPFYSPGASTLVQVLTCLDVSVRLLTLVTYLACPQLRNLPGKLLIGYQVTALLRLLVVLARLEDLTVAVRIDVLFDLSSTLWLTSFLHFLTSSLKTLRTPDSLSPQEACAVLLRYSSLGWVLPAALSASFFFLDEAIQSHVQVGQLLFVLCYLMALFWNLHMIYFNCKLYYDVKKGVVSLRPGVKARSVFTGLFNFVLKTSVLSGAGIIFRLLFTQIQGLEKLLGYYHALGTLQGLLVFILYGCNRESRDFWRRVLFQKLISCFHPPQNRLVSSEGTSRFATVVT